MLGAIVSATDPVAVVSALHSLGAAPKLSHMIEGESSSRRREFCHSAAPPSTFSRCINSDGEGMSVK